MKFISITQDDQDRIVAEAVVHREKEIWHYQLNINNYTAMLASLGAGVLSEHDAAFRDKITALLGTEKIEQAKSMRVLDALLSQLPAGQAESLVLAAKAKLDAAVATATTI